MAAVARRQAELGEDVADVLVDGVLGDHQACGDLGVVLTPRHQGEDLAFARGERRDGVTRGTGQELGDDLGVHHDAAGGHAAQRFGELTHPGDPVLEEVAEAARAVGEKLACVLPPDPAGLRAVRGRRTSLDVTDQTDFSGATGGLVTTTADLNRFLHALLGGRLLRPAQLRLMLTSVPVSDEPARLWPGARDGLGLFSRPLSCGGVYWGHEGGRGGYATANGVTADASRSVVVSMSTALGREQVQQEQAAAALVDHALCGKPAKP